MSAIRSHTGRIKMINRQMHRRANPGLLPPAAANGDR